jgi:hypothetical protein
MDGRLPQRIALTCYGNAVLSGRQAPKFFPDNSSCSLCASLVFVTQKTQPDGSKPEITIAGSFERWIDGLRGRGVFGLRLLFLKRMHEWTIEAVRRDSSSEFWVGDWERLSPVPVAPDRRFFRAVFHYRELCKTVNPAHRPLAEVAASLRSALREIRAFSEQQHCFSGFTACFDSALRALDEPQFEPGDYKDLDPADILPIEGSSLLKAGCCASVFGGMGSWSDQFFDDKEIQQEYSRVSGNLSGLLDETIEVAVGSSMPCQA